MKVVLPGFRDGVQGVGSPGTRRAMPRGRGAGGRQLRIHWDSTTLGEIVIFLNNISLTLLNPVFIHLLYYPNKYVIE